MPNWILIALIVIGALIIGVLLLMIATFMGMKTKRDTGTMRGTRKSKRTPDSKNSKSRAHKSR
tara:strand:+ start:12636 stop:12824 length:189 start_codon:yes stop_codon:yes gene_type:complete